MASPLAIHLGDKLDTEILDTLADFIYGDEKGKNRFPTYRSSTSLTRFFQNMNIDVTHDGTTRKLWMLEVLKQLQPSDIEKVILRLVDPREYGGVGDNFKQAVQIMNEILIMENLAVELDNVRPYIKSAELLKFEGAGILKASTKDEAEFLSKQFGDDLKIQELGLDSGLAHGTHRRQRAWTTGNPGAGSKYRTERIPCGEMDRRGAGLSARAYRDKERQDQ